MILLAVTSVFVWLALRPQLTSVVTAHIPPIPCRDDLAIVAEEFFSQTGNAAEIGVYQGDFSKKNVGKWSGQYYMIDAWQFRKVDAENGLMDKNYQDSATNDQNMQVAKENALQHAGVNKARIHVIRSLSVPAAALFPDKHFDWLYLDAMHDYENVLNDLKAWWPKLRPGGLMSGDDYGDSVDTPLMTSQRFAAKFSENAYRNGWGVQRAVLEFANLNGLTLHVTWANDCYREPAWYLVKPLRSD